MALVFGTAAGEGLNGTESDDLILGLQGNDTLNGLGGNDTLDGGVGNDTLIGGGGNDFYVVDSATDVIGEGPGGGTDTVLAFVNYTLANNAEKLQLAGALVINGTGTGAGDVLIGNIGANRLTGLDGDDRLSGSFGDDSLEGGDGNDTLIGGQGTDSLIGGAGDDVYVDTLLRNSSDGTLSLPGSITEATDGGNDTLQVRLAPQQLTFTFPDNSAFTMSRVSSATDPLVGSWVATGAGDANSTLVVTFLANGTFMLAEDGDPVADPNGTDGMERGTYTWSSETGSFAVTSMTVNTNGEWGLSASAPLVLRIDGDELKMLFAGGDNLTLSRVNSDSNPLVGAWTASNAGEARSTLALTFLEDGTFLLAEDGDRTLDPSGRDGIERGTYGWNPDTQAFSIGIDTTEGGVNTNGQWGFSHGDSPVKATPIYPPVSPFAVVLTANMDDLDLRNTGTSRLDGTGNELANVMFGNEGVNLFTGGGGDDSINGYGGNDTLEGGDGGDTASGGAGNDLVGGDDGEGFGNDLLFGDMGNDTVAGDEGDDTLHGGDGNDIVEGGDGNDTASGGAGNDLLGGDDGEGFGNDVLDGEVGHDTLAGDEGSDTLYGGEGNDFIEGDSGLPADAGDDLLSGDSGADRLFGRGGNDTLDGGAGLDSLWGGTGNDVYFVSQGTDVVVEKAGEGVDTIRSIVTRTLGDHQDNLVLIGEGAVNGIGNGLHNIIDGNGAINTLNGGSGNDTVSGAEGNDTIVGGAGDDMLDGGTGLDHMVGGTGNDVYVVDSDGDSVTEKSAQGLDTVLSSISRTLGNHQENLTLMGEDSIDGTGNSLDNVMDGNDAINTLLGGDGNDTINGNGGDDTIFGGAGNDSIDGGTGADSMIGGSGSDTYFVEFGDGDNVFEEDGASGVDTIITNGAITMPEWVENLVWLANDNGGGFCSGNALGNLMTAEAAAGELTMDGNLGNDTISFAGLDLALTIDLDLDDGSSTIVEHLRDMENAIGGELDDIITGNEVANILDGSAGADEMAGGYGGDTYVVDDAGDVVIESDNVSLLVLPGGSGPGAALADITDTVLAAINYSLESVLFVENIVLTGTALNATGNAENNLITGNARNNLLDGLAGADTLNGGAGNDTLVWRAGESPVGVYNGGTGTDTLAIGAGPLNLKGVAQNAILSVERIDLRGDGKNLLTLTRADIIDMSSIDKLTVLGDSGDRVGAAGFTRIADSGIYRQYVSGAATLLVENDVTVVT
jgi:Ca2+-binding RTX toxin-like protein